MGVVSLYFGLPGAGKTTFGAALAVREQKLIEKHQSQFKYVFTNFPIAYPGIYKVSARDLGKVDVSDALVVLDEASLIADSRDYKTFSHEMKLYFLLIRHFHCRCILLTQQWDAVDKKIRVITDSVYYVHKGAFRRWISYASPIPYGIIIPDKKDNTEKYGEIIQGYCKAPLLQRIFAPRIRRSKYYKYFDSYDRPKLLPNKFVQWYSSAVPAAEGSGTDSETT